MKRSLMKVMPLAIGLCMAVSAYAEINSDLILYYSFDNLESTAELIPDLSGNNNSGTRMGNAYYADGKFGQAIECDTKGEDYAYFPDGLLSCTTDFTIAAYVYKKDYNGWDRLVDFARDTDYNMFVTTNGPGNIRFAIKSYGTVDAEGNTIYGEQRIDCAVKPTLNAWTHIAVTIKYTNGIGLGSLYVNGVLVGTNDHITLKPSDLGYTTQNFLGRSVYSADPALNGAIDEFRVYNRALTEDDIIELTGTPAEITKAYKEWDLATELELDDYVSTDIALPATIYDGKVHIDWVSDDESLVDSNGKIINLPAKYPDATILTANMWQENSFGDTTYVSKHFGVKFKPAAMQEVDPLVAKFVFDSNSTGTDEEGNITIKDQGPYAFVGKVLGGARMVTMGSNQDPHGAMFIEESGGYFDMGEEIGKAVQGLTDYTISVFYRKDANDNTYSSYGQHLYTFSNGNIANEAVGAIYCEPYRGYHCACTTNYGDETGIEVGTFPMGSWHNVTYVQFGNAGKLYVDGVLQGESDAVYLPCYALKAQGKNPPVYNYIGKPCYFSDPWTTNTHFASLTLYNLALSESDLEDPDILGITSQLQTLDAAYAENPEVVGEDFQQEYDALAISSMEDLKTGDFLELPTQGTINPAIKISWVSSHPEYLSSEGVVTSPKYFPLDSVVLIATLQQGTTTKEKFFSGNIVLEEEGGYKGDVLADWDFSKAQQDSTVIDQAEMHFEGGIVNDSYIATIGEGEGKINVLYLGEGAGYFDMGTEIGKAIVGLKDYTVSVYYRKDDEDGTLTAFEGYGQSLYSFSNSQALASEAYGAMFYEPLRDRHVCTPDNYASEGTNHVGSGANVMVGSWHNISYVQYGDSGILYHDGFEVARQPIGTPAKNLWRFGMSGTPYNYIGKPCYAGDPYLQKTMIAQLKIWNRSLSEEEVNAGMDNMIQTLDAAYDANNGQGSILAVDLKALAVEARNLVQLDYAGKADLQKAIEAAEEAIAGNNVTQADIDALKAAMLVYQFTKPGSAAKPADYTFAITNPSFEDGWSGTLQEGSIQEYGSYAYPTGWEVYTNVAGWCNLAKITDNPADGAYSLETWAATINEFDVHQDIYLPAGWYILSAAGRTNAGSWDSKVYAAVGEKTYYSETFDENMNNGVSAWNGVDNWQTLYCPFEVKTAGTLKIGMNTHTFVQVDNFRLQYTGSEEPTEADLTYAIINPSFEEGEGGTFDSDSEGGPGDYQAPFGWTVYYNTTGGWTSCLITTAPSTSGEGEAHGYEIWSSTINLFEVYQEIEAPASGWYTLSADMRCDASSISNTDLEHPFDAHLVATVKPYGKQVVSKTLFEAAGLTEITGSWIPWTKVETPKFYASVGETILIEDVSTSTMQSDNFRLNYHGLDYNSGEPEEQFTLGDVNNDGKINAGDFVGVVNLILGNYTEGLIREAADVNKDSQVNVGDCVGLTNYILYGYFQQPSNVAALSSYNGGESTSVKVSADDFSVTAGEIYDLAVSFSDMEKYTAMQMDVVIPEGLSFVTDARGRANVRWASDQTHSLASAMQKDGSLRLLGYSNDNTLFNKADNAGIILKVRAAETVESGTARIQLRGVQVVGTDAQPVSVENSYATVTFNAPTGLENVRQEAAERVIYNVLGQRVSDGQLAPGIYIINGRKVVVRKVQ